MTRRSKIFLNGALLTTALAACGARDVEVARAALIKCPDGQELAADDVCRCPSDETVVARFAAALDMDLVAAKCVDGRCLMRGRTDGVTRLLMFDCAATIGACPRCKPVAVAP